MPKTRIVNWNINWRRRDSPAGAQILKETFAVDPDIVCLTEGHVDFLPDTGAVITGSNRPIRGVAVNASTPRSKKTVDRLDLASEA